MFPPLLLAPQCSILIRNLLRLSLGVLACHGLLTLLFHGSPRPARSVLLYSPCRADTGFMAMHSTAAQHHQLCSRPGQALVYGSWEAGDLLRGCCGGACSGVNCWGLCRGCRPPPQPPLPPSGVSRPSGSLSCGCGRRLCLLSPGGGPRGLLIPSPLLPVRLSLQGTLTGLRLCSRPSGASGCHGDVCR